MARLHLQPRNATPMRKALAEAGDYPFVLEAPVSASRGKKLTSPEPAWLPYLVYEYGLNELTPYVPNLYEVIDEGIQWQRMRGTPAALARALNWLEYSGTLEEFPTRRRKWALFMVGLDQLRVQETPDLDYIDGVSNLSAPLRSYFWRGFHDYDVRALETAHTKLAVTRLSSFSGVRIPAVASKWSYGRRFTNEHTLTEVELTSLGAWIPTGDVDPGWGDFAWDTPGFTWSSPSEAVRKAAIAASLTGRSAWLELKDAGNDVIGYRRARIIKPVKATVGGSYRFNSLDYAENTDAPTAMLFEAMTDFGDGYGSEVAFWGVVFDATITDENRPGQAWATAAEMTGLTDPVAVTSDTALLGRTIRERFTALLKI